MWKSAGYSQANEQKKKNVKDDVETAGNTTVLWNATEVSRIMLLEGKKKWWNVEVKEAVGKVAYKRIAAQMENKRKLLIESPLNMRKEGEKSEDIQMLMRTLKNNYLQFCPSIVFLDMREHQHLDTYFLKEAQAEPKRIRIIPLVLPVLSSEENTEYLFSLNTQHLAETYTRFQSQDSLPIVFLPLTVFLY